MADRIDVRIAEPGDGAAFAAIYAPIVVETAISFETEPPSAEVMGERVIKTLATHPWLTAMRDGEVVGYAYAGAHRERAAYRWSCDVTVYVAQAGHRSGVGGALYRTLLPLLQRQGLRSAFAGIALPNAGSVGLHEAVGFTPIGVYREVGYKLGAWRDVGWWRLGLSRHDGPPAEPLSFPQLTALPGFSLTAV
ncbi:arsinothricin resistance N-acetyltransferase ArsN1 family B [Phenylobacterium sp.]|uniref:arsinothricin resistance N-acetyltransferase ArsN1 family B n=1 Tax=Phenylobacterium sp. TaxID=1871053 RepID=UPI002718356E|nr:arsinothricin resistance N-acetyltransferase ArsN1 family B [Phenylobacterium sp.]MDO8799050.1 N-acetyltransferase family protein [Phenylobacterium sp.]